MKYQLEKCQYSYWQKETRFYVLELCQDIWGAWIVKSTWGSAVKLDYGRSTSTVCPDYEAGLQLHEKQLSRRQKRGYESMSTNCLHEQKY